jgi:nucleotide-binding universal stress UspA family protein
MIVVGVEGSDGGAAALEFAAEEAALRRTSLRVVSAWEIPTAVYTVGTAPPVDPATLDAFRLRAEQAAEDAVATVRSCSRRSPSKL